MHSQDKAIANRRTLVLNQDYSPLTICSVHRAFLLVYLQKAELLSEALNASLKTVTRTFPAPAVIRLRSYIYLPYKGVVLSRQNIFKRDGYECQYCGTTRDLTLDHLVPKARGGKSSWLNLVTACRRCNARKGDFTPEEVGMSVKNRPFKPSYVIFLRDYSGLVCEEWKPYLLNGKEKPLNGKAYPLD